MKSCKSCVTEIDDAASKCPHCQAFQKWYMSPQIYSVVFFIPLMWYIFFGIDFSGESFEEYKQHFSVKRIQVRTVDKEILLTYQITNNSEYKWSDLVYQLVAKDESGVETFVKSDSEYRWIIQPHSSSVVTVTVPQAYAAATWEFILKDMETSRF